MIAGGLLAMATLPAGLETTSAYAATVESGIAPAESITIPSANSEYFYVGSTAGGQPMGSISWSQDLSVIASYSGNEAISIGRSASNTGSYSSGAGNHAIAGAGISGYSVAEVFSNDVSATGAGAAGGTQLELPFKTQSGDLVLILVGGEGTGSLQLSGIAANTLQNETYSEAGSDVIASAAIYTAELSGGSYTARWDSTTYATNSGTSLGAVAYVLAPTAPAAPVVNGMSPAEGSARGGETITVKGSGFATEPGTTSFSFGGSTATKVSCSSTTSCTVTDPQHAAGTVRVMATVDGVSSNPTAVETDKFTYVTLFEVTVKMWIPQEYVVDPGSCFFSTVVTHVPSCGLTPYLLWANLIAPAEAFMPPAECNPGGGLSSLLAAVNTKFRGDNYAPFTGGSTYRGLRTIIFGWNGTEIISPDVMKPHTTSHLAIEVQRLFRSALDCIEEKGAVEEETFSSTPTTFSLTYGSENGFLSVVAPLAKMTIPGTKISFETFQKLGPRIALSGSVASNGTLTLTASSFSQFPSIGISVAENGGPGLGGSEVIDTVNDASCLNASAVLGIDGVLNLFAGFDHMSASGLKVPEFAPPSPPMDTKSALCASAVGNS
ncbi:MAG TPA: IPT/TIG domain-containing protein [Solirubrobacteraceae bacterium]|nr:IPT/TIG domain-containing protein [Solirubrobacteraceae bacterium]